MRQHFVIFNFCVLNFFNLAVQIIILGVYNAQTVKLLSIRYKQYKSVIMNITNFKLPQNCITFIDINDFKNDSVFYSNHYN